MFTKIECGECGDNYAPSMDEGESLKVRGGVLGYVTEVA